MNACVGFLLIGISVGVFSEHQPPAAPPPFLGKWSSPRVKRSTQCYDDLGCFSNTYPFNNSDQALPLNPRFIRTRFFLFTTINERFPRLINRNSPDQLQRTRYDSNKPTTFIIHGFEQYGMVSWTKRLARELILKEPTNIIIVDWGHGSGWPYTQAVANTRVVGAEVAKMIEYLIAETNLDVSSIHLIGHSLGAHVAGYAGEALNGRLRRITGLDPAEPNYKGTDTRVRLDPNDAVFVDVIHTDGSAFDEISGYGLMDPVGDVDFYPNGGQNQPGCTKETWVNLVSQSYRRGIMKTSDNLGCSHSRSIALFTESINGECQFHAFPCDSFTHFKEGQCLSCNGSPCPVLGFQADKYERSTNKPRGKYYLVTDRKDPYCGYTYSAEVHFTSGMQPSEGLLELSFIGANGQNANHSFYRTEYTGGQIYRDLILTHTQLQSISTVQVRFLENSKLWSWIWAGTVQINMVVLIDGQSNQRTLFCGNDVTINSGRSVILTGASDVVCINHGNIATL